MLHFLHFYLAPKKANKRANNFLTGCANYKHTYFFDMEQEEKTGQNPLSELSADLQQYVRVQSDILRLELTSKVAVGSSVLALVILVALIAFVLVIFMALSLGLWLSDVTGSYVQGFGIVTAIIFVKLLLILVFRKKLITRPIQNAIIKNALNTESDDENE